MANKTLKVATNGGLGLKIEGSAASAATPGTGLDTLAISGANLPTASTDQASGEKLLALDASGNPKALTGKVLAAVTADTAANVPASAAPSQAIDGSAHNGSGTAYMLANAAPALAATVTPPSGLLTVAGRLTVTGALTGLASQARTLVDPTGETYWWPMNDNAANGNVVDVGASALTRTLNSGNTSAHTVTGKVGAALAFAGSGDYLYLAHGSGNSDAAWLTALTALNCDFSLAFWVRLHLVAVTQIPFSINGRNGSACLSSQTYYTGYVYLAVWMTAPDGTTLNLAPAFTGWDNVWHHFAITRAGSTWTTYHNGSAYATATPTGGNGAWYTSVAASDFFVIGANPSYPTSSDWDDVRAFNRALSAAEITTLYGSGAGSAASLAAGITIVPYVTFVSGHN